MTEPTIARFRRSAAVSLALFAAVGLAACGSSDPAPTETVTVTPDASGADDAASAGTPSTGTSAADSGEDSATSDAPKEASGSAEASGRASAAATEGGSGNAGADDPFGGMAAASGSVDASQACEYIDGFQAKLPGNVERDPAGARNAVAALQKAAPQELRGQLNGLDQVLRNYENGNNPMQAVEGKVRGLANHCRGLAHRG